MQCRLSGFLKWASLPWNEHSRLQLDVLQYHSLTYTFLGNVCNMQESILRRISSNGTIIVSKICIIVRNWYH